MTTEPNTVVATPSVDGADTGKVGSFWSGKRFYIALFLFFNFFITYTHRINLSVATPAIAKEYGWDSGTMGLLLSSYQWTYCLFLLPWGWLTDRMGTRFVNAASTVIRGFAGLLTGVSGTFGTMLATRLGLGFGEAAQFPGSGKVVREWFPASERGLATSVFNAGTFAGPAFSAPLIAWMVTGFGWRTSFLITGTWGFVWVTLWLKYFRIPSECPWLSKAERNFILAQSDSKAKGRPPKGAISRLLSRKTMWGLFLTQGMCAYTMLLFLFWLPAYLVQGRHMTLAKAAWFTAIPYTVAVVLGILIGKLSDSILTHEAVRQGKRRSLLIVFILLSSVVILTNMFSNEYLLLILISMSLTCISSALSLNIAMTSDLVWNSSMVGTAISIIILGGNIFGSIVPIVTGYIVKWTGSFNLAFYLAGGLLFLAALTSFTMTRTPMSFDETEA
jgi:MFS family permease